MVTPTCSRLSVSTYSLSHILGATYQDSPGTNGQRTRVDRNVPGTCSLLELPAQIAAHGIGAMEISHPHLPSREPAYLDELRAAISDAGIHLLSVLIEDGDITHPDHAERDLAWIGDWIETAGRLGAERARVIAGKQPYTAEALEKSRRGIALLAERGREHGVRITTENWFDLLSCPEAVHSLVDSLEGNLGFNIDFGNWGGPTKYEDLASIFPLAESAHAKCNFAAPGNPDADDFRHCLELSRAAEFAGPYTLIYSSGGDEWEGLRIEREMVLPYLAIAD